MTFEDVLDARLARPIYTPIDSLNIRVLDAVKGPLSQRLELSWLGKTSGTPLSSCDWPHAYENYWC